MNNEAPELSPEARRIISEARGFDDPTPEDRARVKARWLAGIAAVAGVSSLTEAARAAGGIGWGLKAAGTALVLAAGALGLHFALSGDDSQPEKPGASHAAERPAWSGTTHARFEKTPARASREAEKEKNVALEGLAVESQPAESQPAESQPALAAPVTPMAQPVVQEPKVAAELAETGGLVPAAPAEAAPEKPVAARAVSGKGAAGRPVAARSKASKEPSPAPETSPTPASTVPTADTPDRGMASGQLGEELSLLSEVRTSMQEGAPNRALELLARYEARFGQPILGMEADALRVDALCRAGQGEAARESARAFQNEWPGSPLRQRVSAACP